MKLSVALGRVVNSITNDSIRHFTEEMLLKSFVNMKLPASRSHHLPDEREEFGNTLHTLRVASLCKLIADAVSVEDGSALNTDILKSAACLHDVCRHGLLGLSEESRPAHPYLVRELAREFNLTCDYFDDIMAVIESHMGRWGEKPVAFEIDTALALHLADCIVARWAEVMPDGRGEGACSAQE